MTIALVDGDLIAYRCAASAEKDTADIAMIRASRLLSDIITTTDAHELKLYLSGSSNFRKEIYPEYKANREKLVRPVFLQPLREYLVKEWNAEITDGIEADDALGMESGENKIICSLDKDLLQIPGVHYNFVNREFREITEREGRFNFYSQLVLGDKADNVPGFDGKMRPKWPKFLAVWRNQLEAATSSYQCYTVVKELYGSTNQEILIRNARLLYIWRKENDEWVVPTAAETMSGAAQEAVMNSESIAMTQAATSPSTALGGTKPKKGGFPKRGRKKVVSSQKKRQGR